VGLSGPEGGERQHPEIKSADQSWEGRQGSSWAKGEELSVPCPKTNGAQDGHWKD